MHLQPFLLAACFGLTAAIPAFGTVFFVTHTLDKAFTEQCAKQDWPTHQHAAHVDLCIEHEKPTPVTTFVSR